MIQYIRQLLPTPLKYKKARIHFNSVQNNRHLKMTPVMPTIIITSTSQHLQQKHAFYIQHAFILTLEFTVQYSVYFLAFSRNSVFRKTYHTYTHIQTYVTHQHFPFYDSKSVFLRKDNEIVKDPPNSNLNNPRQNLYFNRALISIRQSI